MAFFLALDVGGTKTDYVLADESCVLARVRTGSIKRMRTEATAAAAYLDAGLAELVASTGVAMSAVSRTCVGTAGNTVPLVTDWLRSELRARVGGELLVLGDVDIALDAAFPGEAGVLVLAGTGSNVAGRGTDQRVFTVGGWGPALSDQGSGHRIGQQALRAVALAHDAGEANALFEAVLNTWNLRSFDDLVERANALPGPDVSQLVQTVVRCAAEGDFLAQQVLREQGEELAAIVLLLLARLQKISAEPDFVPSLAFAGSIMEHVPAVRQALLKTVRQQFPSARELPGVVDPPLGALWRARTGSGFGAAAADREQR
ncbi:MAG: N-acetylglucosamine kinase [Janthinobacterium lividum]